MDGMGTVLFFLHLTWGGGEIKRWEIFPGRDRRERDCGGAGDSSRLPWAPSWWGHVVPHLCTAKNLVPHSPALLCKPRVKCFKARNLNSLFTGISGCLGWKVVMVPLGHRGWGYKRVHSSSLWGAESPSVKLLEIFGSRPAMEMQSAFAYFETKMSPNEKNQIKCAGESVRKRRKK